MRRAALVFVAGCSFAPGTLRVQDDGGTTETDDAPDIDASLIDASNDASIDAPDSMVVNPSPERRIKLTFQNATRPSNLDGFAVLVKLDSTVINYGAVGAQAVDLRFKDGDGTALPYEIEKWNTAGTSFVWVRVPRIDASSNTDFIWLHYGDPALTTDGQNKTAVWSNAVAVYHLAEDPGPGNVDDIKDSSVAARHGTASATLASTNRVPTMIGDGLDLPGDKTGITATNVTLTNYTYQFWVRGDAAPVTGSGNKQPLSDGDTNFNWSWDHNLTAFTAAAAHRDAGTTWYSISAATLTGGTWYLVAGTYNGTSLCMSVNGAAPACLTAAAPSAPSSASLLIGSSSSSASVSFNGMMDEVRVHSVARSADWLNAEYASQRADTNAPFVTFGSPEVVP